MVLNSIKNIIFDLDNTIYDEYEYLKIVYLHCSKQICKLEQFKTDMINKMTIFMLNYYLNNGHSNLYQYLAKEFNLKKTSLMNFKEFLHNAFVAKNSIRINEKIYKFINENINRKNFYILTNGNPLQQRKKIDSLIIPFKDKIKVYYASSLGKNFEKPNPYFLLNLISEEKLDKSNVIYIGDSEIDRITALRADVKFLHIGDFLNEIK